MKMVERENTMVMEFRKLFDISKVSLELENGAR